MGLYGENRRIFDVRSHSAFKNIREDRLIADISVRLG